MKKLVLLWVSILLSTAIFAQDNVSWYHVYGSVVVKGGYNVLEKQPVAAVDIYADIGFLRAQLEMMYAWFDASQKPFFPFAPSFGVTYGDEHIVYLLVGGQPWPSLSIRDGTTESLKEVWHFKIEGGVDFRLSDLLFINVGATYFLPRKNTETLYHYQNLAFMAGLGFNF